MNRQKTLKFQKAKFEDEKARTQLKIAIYTHVTIHSAIRTCDHMVSLCNTCFTDSKASGFKLSRTKCTSLIYIYKTECLFAYFVCKSTVVLRS
jgi:hypothetical protein